MKKDIETRSDIDLLMRDFYERALADDLIGFIFTDVAHLDLGAHLPIIGDFWEAILFRSGGYHQRGRNPLQVHGALNEKVRLLPEHFDRWLEIFTKTVDERYCGEMSDFLKLRARAIAVRMLEFVSSNATAVTH
jgi:hemoglobin